LTFLTSHPSLKKWVLLSLAWFFGGLLVACALFGILVIQAYPKLPSLEALADYRPKIPLRVYTADGYLIGEFGQERRSLVPINEVPDVMKHAILAAEDKRFYQHSGIDTIGVLRAIYANLSGGKRQGASTITMQVAKNFFLSPEKTLTRKFYEALLSFKIENNFTKDEILQLYINQIYLGQRAYGFAAASQIYFGKPLQDITIAEAAMLAGLPQLPSYHNPVVNPKGARQRQLEVLRRMAELDYITAEQLEAAKAESLYIKRDVNDFGIHAEHVAEMARQIAYDRYQEDAYTIGLKVITTIRKADQEAAYEALKRGVLDYDHRHGYRGAEAYVDLNGVNTTQEEMLEERLQDFEDSNGMMPALVLTADEKQVTAFIRGGETVTLTGNALKFATAMLTKKAPANRRIRPGAIIRISKDAKGAWQIAQIPNVEAALVSANSQNGEIRALVGGLDFNRNKFNHVTQAWRQPGSSFKPFIYSAALEKGYSPASIFPDEPVTLTAEETGSQVWEPNNYDGKYDGPMTLRTALAKSKNMVSIRLLQQIGVRYAQDYITRFGFDADKNPPYLTLALGSGSVTPWQQLAAYSVFANGGYKIEPHIVKQIVDAQGAVLAAVQPVKAGDENQRVIDPRNAYMMDSMLKDVARRGTAAQATVTLKRYDIAGKTGTTNDYIDAWFCGYQPDLVAIAWIGFDQPRRMGSGETGTFAALPIWLGYMGKALSGVPEHSPTKPKGLTTITIIDPATEREVQDFIYQEHLPPPPEEETQQQDMIPFVNMPKTN
jgi:penicillin-binding protein 1A